MAAKAMVVAVSTLLLLPVTLTKTSFADSLEKLGIERLQDASGSQDGIEMESPIPNVPEMDQDEAPATTLELRLANNVCPRSAQWVEHTGKCDLVSSEPLKLHVPTVSQPQ